MRYFYLVQRGTFAEKIPPDACLTGCKGIVSLDYMADVRFEMYAIPKAFRRIMWNYMNYGIYSTGIKTYEGRQLKLFCHSDKKDKIISAIKEFIECPWIIPRPSQLDLAVNEGHISTNFWWCIDFPREYNLSDWMLFYSEDEEKFKTAIENDYNNWWMKMLYEEREEEYKKSLVW